jgi:hypothetical protein
MRSPIDAVEFMLAASSDCTFPTSVWAHSTVESWYYAFIPDTCESDCRDVALNHVSFGGIINVEPVPESSDAPR